MEPEAAPFMNCRLVDWFGPESKTKSLKSGARKFFIPFTSEVENVKDTSNCSFWLTVVLFTEAVKVCDLAATGDNAIATAMKIAGSAALTRSLGSICPRPDPFAALNGKSEMLLIDSGSPSCLSLIPRFPSIVPLILPVKTRSYQSFATFVGFPTNFLSFFCSFCSSWFNAAKIAWASALDI